MGSKAEYRSAIRSRKLIKTAFMELAAEKEISKITVKDIADRADRGNGRSSLSTKPKPTMTTGAPILRVTRTSSLISSASRTAVSIKRT